MSRGIDGLSFFYPHEVLQITRAGAQRPGKIGDKRPVIIS